jgi:hypothetical protein
MAAGFAPERTSTIFHVIIGARTRRLRRAQADQKNTKRIN